MPLTEARYFCTLFDSGYLLKGWVMLRTLRQHCPAARVFVLCMDAQCKSILEQLALPGVHCVGLAEVENPALLEAKKTRNVAEYCWTLSASLTSWVMDSQPEVDLITYLDADLMFFAPPQALFDEARLASITIIEHRFTSRLRHLEENGRFCVQWVSFRRDPVGLACLRRWRDQCIEWCFARLEDGRMGDQKYLDEWPERYKSVHILQHPGAGLAPWNFPDYAITEQGGGRILVNGRPLVFYHFHQFHLLDDGGFDWVAKSYTQDKEAPACVYRSYEQQLTEAIAEVRACVPGFNAGMKSTAYIKSRRWAHRFLPQALKQVLKRIVRY